MIKLVIHCLDDHFANKPNIVIRGAQNKLQSNMAEQKFSSRFDLIAVQFEHRPVASDNSNYQENNLRCQLKDK